MRLWTRLNTTRLDSMGIDSDELDEIPDWTRFNSIGLDRPRRHQPRWPKRKPNKQTDRMEKKTETKGRGKESKQARPLSRYSGLSDCFVSSVLLRWLERMHLGFQLELLRCRSALRTWTRESSSVLRRTTILGIFGCVVFVGLGSGCCQTCSFAGGGGGAGSGVGTSGGGASGAGRSGNGMSGAAGDGDVLDFLLYFLRS